MRIAIFCTVLLAACGSKEETEREARGKASELADMVSDAWVTFARTGDPNTARHPRWPQFDPARRPTMVFNDETAVEDDPIREERIAMFEAMAEVF